MKYSPIIFTLLFPAILIGCVKPGETRVENAYKAYVNETNAIYSNYHQCASANRDIKIITKKYHLDSVASTMITDYIEPELKEVFLRSWQGAEKCYNELSVDILRVSPRNALILSKYYNAQNKIRIKFLQEKITVGEYSIRMKDANNDFLTQEQKVNTQIQNEYLSAHNAEVSENDRIADAISKAVTDYHKSRAENYKAMAERNKVTTTNCHIEGSYMRCTEQ